jgi:hypothetical protein
MAGSDVCGGVAHLLLSKTLVPAVRALETPAAHVGTRGPVLVELDARQGRELVERRRRGQRPFQRRCASPHGLSPATRFFGEGFDDAIQEDQHAEAEM